MKKQLLCLLLMVIILPLSSFNLIRINQFSVKKAHIKETEGYIGFFEKYGHEYTVVGDNIGGASGNVTHLIEVGYSGVIPVSGTWARTYGTAHNLLGATVTFTTSDGQSGSFSAALLTEHL